MDYMETLSEELAECIRESERAAHGKYDEEDASQTTAKFLTVSLKVSYVLEQLELEAKRKKNEVSRLESEVYLQSKNNKKDKDDKTKEKMTDTALSHIVSQNTLVVAAKDDYAKAEAALKKWSYIHSTLKDGMVYFRNLSKSNPDLSNKQSW